MRDDSDSNMYDSLLSKPVELILTCIMHNMQNTNTFHGHISVAFIIDLFFIWQLFTIWFNLLTLLKGIVDSNHSALYTNNTFAEFSNLGGLISILNMLKHFSSLN